MNDWIVALCLDSGMQQRPSGDLGGRARSRPVPPGPTVPLELEEVLEPSGGSDDWGSSSLARAGKPHCRPPNTMTPPNGHRHWRQDNDTPAVKNRWGVLWIHEQVSTLRGYVAGVRTSVDYIN